MEEQRQRNITSEWEIWMLANSSQSHFITLAWGATINDNRNIKTNEKQTLNDKFKQTELQKYEITSQESSRWTVCSSESAKLRKFFFFSHFLMRKHFNLYSAWNDYFSQSQNFFVVLYFYACSAAEWMLYVAPPKYNKCYKMFQYSWHNCYKTKS